MLKKNITSLSKATAANFRARRLEWLLVGLMSLLFLFTLCVSFTARPYTSDDVAIQSVLQSWADQPHKAIITVDTWALKIPFYLISDVLAPNNSRLKLFSYDLLFNAVLVVGVVCFVREFLGKLYQKRSKLILLAYLPFVWYLSISALPDATSSYTDIARSAVFMNPNYRNAEIGLALLLVIATARFIQNGFSLATYRSKLSALALLGFTALFFYNDPYFVYILALPIGVVAAGLWIAHRLTIKRTASLIVFLLIALAASLLLNKLFAHLGYVALDNVPKQFTTLNNILQTTLNGIWSIFKMYNANFWGLELKADIAVYLLNSLLAIGGLASFVWGWRKLNKASVLHLLLLAVATANFLSYILTINGDLANSRYLIMAVFCLLPLTSEMLIKIASQKNTDRLIGCIVAISAIAIVFNIGSNLSFLRNTLNQASRGNGVNYEIIDIAKRNGLTKGYTDYWDGNINTYLSNGRVHFLPVVCEDTSIKQLHWLLNPTQFNLDADKSFFLLDRATLGNVTSLCDPTKIINAFGKPARTIDINPQYTLYIYNYDIGRPLQPAS